MLKTPLYDTHLRLGGRLVDFAGWSLPVSFAGINEEHVHTRTACSVFDVSHMGRLRLTGKDCHTFLERICTRNLGQAEPGRSFYSHICREDGGVLDDVIVSCGEGYWGSFATASTGRRSSTGSGSTQPAPESRLPTRPSRPPWLRSRARGRWRWCNRATGLDLSELKRYRFITRNVFGMEVAVYRQGLHW